MGDLLLRAALSSGWRRYRPVYEGEVMGRAGQVDPDDGAQLADLHRWAHARARQVLPVRSRASLGDVLELKAFAVLGAAVGRPHGQVAGSVMLFEWTKAFDDSLDSVRLRLGLWDRELAAHGMATTVDRAGWGLVYAMEAADLACAAVLREDMDPVRRATLNVAVEHAAAVGRVAPEDVVEWLKGPGRQVTRRQVGEALRAVGA